MVCDARTVRRRSRPGSPRGDPGRLVVEDSGDHRLSRDCTIMGPAGLTAVFGMGTGVTPPVWSPENRPAGCQATAGRDSAVVGHRHMVFTRHQRKWHVCKNQNQPFVIWHLPVVIRIESVRPPDRPGWRCCAQTESRSGWSSCLAVRTGRLRRSPAVHARPIDLVVFQEPMQHLLRETSSRRGLRA